MALATVDVKLETGLPPGSQTHHRQTRGAGGASGVNGHSPVQFHAEGRAIVEIVAPAGPIPVQPEMRIEQLGRDAAQADIPQPAQGKPRRNPDRAL